MDAKLVRIRELIDEKERIDGELDRLLGATEPSKRGRPRKDKTDGNGAEADQTEIPT